MRSNKWQNDQCALVNFGVFVRYGAELSCGFERKEHHIVDAIAASHTYIDYVTKKNILSIWDYSDNYYDIRRIIYGNLL